MSPGNGFFEATFGLYFVQPLFMIGDDGGRSDNPDALCWTVNQYLSSSELFTQRNLSACSYGLHDLTFCRLNIHVGTPLISCLLMLIMIHKDNLLSSVKSPAALNNCSVLPTSVPATVVLNLGTIKFII